MIKFHLWGRAKICVLLALCAFCSIAWPRPVGSEPIGRGDSRIHMIPSLSAPSVKNGGRLFISALVKARAGVHSVTAEIRDGERVIDTVELKAGSDQVGQARTGLWTAQWRAHSLTEKYYQIRLRATDLDGHSFEDSTLTFSDPVAGVTTPGTTDYPRGEMRAGPIEGASGEGILRSAVLDRAAGYVGSPGTELEFAL